MSETYPLYDWRGRKIATIDAALRLRDTLGRFIPLEREARRDLLASCQIIASRGPSA